MISSNSSSDCQIGTDLFADLARRLRGGESNVAAAILESNSESSRDPEFVIDLLYREYLVLTELGRPPEIDSFCRQFPALEDRLRRLLEIDHEFNDRSVLGQHATIDGRNDTNDTFESRSLGSESIGRYQLLHLIGHGGSSRVFKACQTGLDRIVAVKLLNSSAADEKLEQRFRREAELIAGLHHPGIVQIYDYGNDHGQLYLALEYMETGGLDQKTHEPMAIRDACRLIIEVAGAIQHAHDHSIIHRDLKPSNILLTSEGHAKVADFGLAKKIGASKNHSATSTGTTLGTPGFMAPEQISGTSTQIGPSADVYGIGAILYQLMTSRPPFVADDVLETLRLIREKDPIAPSKLRSGLPRDLEIICLKCLHKEPARRFSTAAELADELQRFVDGFPIQSRATGRTEKLWRWCRRRPLVAGLYAALFTAIAIGMAGILWQWQEATSQAAIANQKHLQSQENFDQARSAIVRLTKLSRRLKGIAGTDEIREQALREVLGFHLKQVDETDDPAAALEAADTHIRIAGIRGDLRNFNEALADLERARGILNQLAADGSGEMRCQELIASSYFNSGLFLGALGQNELAVESFLNAADGYRDCWLKTGNDVYQIQRASALVNASGPVLDGSDPSRALALVDEAIRLFERHSTENNSFVLVNRGLAFESKAIILDRGGHPAEAIPFYEKAVEDLQQAVAIGLENPEHISYLPRVLASLGMVYGALGVEREVWSPYSRQAIQILQERWNARPDRPAIGDQLVRGFWGWAYLHWFDGDRVTAAQIYRDMIETLVRLKDRFPEYTDRPAEGRDIVAWRLCLLWATCPVKELRDGQAALELARKAASERPDEPVALAGLAVAEALYGDTGTAAELLEQTTVIDCSSSPETIKRVIRLAIEYRNGSELQAEDINYLKQRRDDLLNYGGYTRQMAETILQLIEDGQP